MNCAAATPKISVIIPCYNTLQYLEKCVRSVADQTYPKDCLEIILVDDGSTDETGALCDRLAEQLTGIRVIHRANGGSSAARNDGIRAATGEYLGFVDSDDYVSPDMYAHLMEAILRTGASIAQTGRDEIAEDGHRLPDVVTPPEAETSVEAQEFLRTLLMHTGDASFCTKLCKKSLFEAGEGRLFPEGMLNEDFYLLYHMLPEAGRVVILPEQGYHVFYRSGSNSRKEARDRDYFPPVFTDIVRNADDVQAFAAEHFPELKTEAVRFGLIQRLDYLLHIPISKMTGDNSFYRDVVRFLRSHLSQICGNPLLTKKNKCYLLLLAAAPRLVRTLHARARGL